MLIVDANTFGAQKVWTSLQAATGQPTRDRASETWRHQNPLVRRFDRGRCSYEIEQFCPPTVMLSDATLHMDDHLGWEPGDPRHPYSPVQGGLETDQ